MELKDYKTFTFEELVSLDKPKKSEIFKILFEESYEGYEQRFYRYIEGWACTKYYNDCIIPLSKDDYKILYRIIKMLSPDASSCIKYLIMEAQVATYDIYHDNKLDNIIEYISNNKDRYEGALD